MKFAKVICLVALTLWLGLSPLAEAARPYNSQFNAVSQVLDYAGVFRPKTLQDLKSYVADSEYYTGNQIVVAIVKSFDGKAPDTYAMQAFQTLKVNTQGKPGVLFVVSKGDRAARIVAGQQLASVLPVNVQAAIIDRVVVPNLKQGKVEKAVIDGVGSIMMALQGKLTPQMAQMQSVQGAAGKKTSWSPLAIIAVIVLLRMAGLGRRRHYGYGRPGYGGGGSFTGSLIGGVIGGLLMGGARRRW